MKIRLLLSVLFCGLMLVTSLQAKLAADRWVRLTEEERHQLTRAERYADPVSYTHLTLPTILRV